MVSLAMITHLHNAIMFIKCKTQSLKVHLFLLVLPAVTACMHWWCSASVRGSDHSDIFTV